jgi:parallel beta-helix repeat protein
MGIYLRRSDGNDIISNNISSNDDHGVLVSDSTGNTILNNTVTLNYRKGITIALSGGNTVIGNNVSYNREGIDIGGSDGNIIRRNNVTFNDQNGIHVRDSEGNNVTHNLVHSSEKVIYLKSSIATNITNNNVSHGTWGILINYSGGNTILNNYVFNNTYGVYLYGQWDSINNRIYHNSIIDNENQSYDASGSKNDWDNGYPLGGNYWSDYNGIDYYKGKNQDIAGSDGIGDTHHEVDSNTRDDYPLMEPYKPLENYTILKQGWNLVSIPLIQDERNLTRALGSTDSRYDTVEFYNISDQNDQWKIYNLGKPPKNDLTEITEKMGFWIHITQPGGTIFVYNGTQPTENQTITLHAGWNLVGYPSSNNKTRTEALNNLTFGYHIDSIWTFNSTLEGWQELGELDYFEVGRGYWIHAITKCKWEVPL